MFTIAIVTGALWVMTAMVNLIGGASASPGIVTIAFTLYTLSSVGTGAVVLAAMEKQR